jgi:hypothetical protein
MLLREVGPVRQRDFDDSRLDTRKSGANRIHRLLPREACANACFKLRI